MTDEELVATLAEALDGRSTRVDVSRPGEVPGYWSGRLPADEAEAFAAALLPVVRRVAEQRASEELLAAADIPLKACCPEHASKRLRARAAALTATPNHGRNAT